MFNAVASDQCIEQTINREQKGRGGISGYSTTTGTLQRWVLTSPSAAQALSKMEQMIEIGKESSVTKDVGSARMLFDESAVRRTCDVLISWGNPFQKSENLINLSSGLMAPYDIESDLLEAHSHGQTALNKFLEDRIKTDEVPFFSPIKRLKLKTFASLKTKSVCKLKEKTYTITAERGMFAKLLVIGEKRCTVSMQELLSYSLGPIPWSLAKPDGTLAKTSKSDLLDVVEDGIDTLEILPAGTVLIFDGMVILQQLQPESPSTFGDISEQILARILRGNANTVYFVTDQYLENSVKEMERNKRASQGVIRFQLSRREQKTPKQWKKYISHSQNKIDLVKFLLRDWSHPERFKDQIGNRRIYASVEEKCYMIKDVDGVIEAVEANALFSNQEEADTKVILCCKHAEESGHQNVCIVTVDSDIAIYNIYYADRMNLNVYVQVGTKASKRILDIGAIQESIGSSISNALPALHAFTDNDYTSAFFGMGKAKAFKVLKSCELFQYTFGMVCEEFAFDEDLLPAIEEFVCKLYGLKNVSSVNEARYTKFCASAKKVPEPQHLPPTKDELLQHCKRVSYVTAVVKRALEANIDIPSPDGYGWRIDRDAGMEIQWMTQKPAPDSIVELVSCNCKKSKCSNQSCVCVAYGLNCTDICNCSNCDNEAVEEEYIDDENDSDSEFSD